MEASDVYNVNSMHHNTITNVTQSQQRTKIYQFTLVLGSLEFFSAETSLGGIWEQSQVPKGRRASVSDINEM